MGLGLGRTVISGTHMWRRLRRRPVLALALATSLAQLAGAHGFGHQDLDQVVAEVRIQFRPRDAFHVEVLTKLLHKCSVGLLYVDQHV